MFDYELEKLRQNSDKWVISFKGIGFYCGNNKFTQKVARAMFFTAKQALNCKNRLESKGCQYIIELVPVALYLNN